MEINYDDIATFLVVVMINTIYDYLRNIKGRKKTKFEKLVLIFCRNLLKLLHLWKRK